MTNDDNTQQPPSFESDQLTLVSCTRKQMQQISKFFADHSGCNRGAIGGARSIESAGTSLGSTIVAKCACGKTLDVTDYESW